MSDTGVFTKIGTGLWSWEPFRRLVRGYGDIIGRCTQLFWIGLYTTPEAKLLVPGMFSGSITTMADACRMIPDEARTYLDRLLEDELVEYDVERRVLRMTMLPDSGESPSNGKAILGWWRRFQTVPECTVRNAHVATLRWIMDEWCRRSGKSLSNDHAKAWSETFGQISVPIPKRRANRPVQTDLFTASGSPISHSSKSNHLDTNTNGTPVPPDPDPDPDKDQDLRSGKSTSHATAPVLRLVPAAPFDADDLAEMLATATGGKFPRALTKTQRLALQRAIELSAEKITGAEVFDVLRDYIARGMPGFDPPRDTMTLEERAERSRGISPEMVAGPGWLAIAIQKASEWASACAEKIELAAQSRKELGFE